MITSLQHLRVIFIAAACSAGLSACYSPRYVYSPPATNVPDLVQKGDSKIGIYYSTGALGTNSGRASKRSFYNRGFDAQGALALTNRLAIFVSQSNRYEKNDGDFNGLIDSSVVVYKRTLTELGAAYFRNSKNKVTGFQLSGGAGFGRYAFTDNGRSIGNQPFSRFHQANVTRLFFQPAFLLRPSRQFTTILAARISGIFFNRIRTNYTAGEQQAFLLDGLEQDGRVFWEPSLINSFGFRNLPGIRIEMQLGFTSLISRRFIDYRTFNFSLGIVADWRRLTGTK